MLCRTSRHEEDEQMDQADSRSRRVQQQATRASVNDQKPLVQTLFLHVFGKQWEEDVSANKSRLCPSCGNERDDVRERRGRDRDGDEEGVVEGSNMPGTVANLLYGNSKEFADEDGWLTYEDGDEEGEGGDDDEEEEGEEDESTGGDEEDDAPDSSDSDDS